MCINQNDPTERDHQVAFMKDIYTRASRVLVWLGTAADDSDAVMDYIQTINPSLDLKNTKDGSTRRRGTGVNVDGGRRSAYRKRTLILLLVDLGSIVSGSSKKQPSTETP